MNNLLKLQEKINKAMKELKSKNLDEFSIQPGNLESLIQATKDPEGSESNETTEALKGVHSVLDELNNYALQLLQNVDHKMVKVRHDKPRPIKKDNS